VLRRLFERLGYQYHGDTAARNIAYYDRRTSHGSTLSFVAHAGVLARLDPASSWQRFLVALRSDADDVQGGTTREGIHIGVMSGTLDLMQRVYPGTEIRDEILYFEPRLPDRIKELSFAMQFRGDSLRVALTQSRLTLASRTDSGSSPVRVGVHGEIHQLRPGEEVSFELSR
jgi:trehalose/maltose hydrolase-like predicted phosphorylase